jgi:hypothetical protein
MEEFDVLGTYVFLLIGENIAHMPLILRDSLSTTIG